MASGRLVPGMVLSLAGGSPVVDALVRGTVLLLVVFLLASALRRGSAGLRHLLWSVGLAGVLLLPLLATSLPPLRLLPWTSSPAQTPSVMAERAAPSAPAPASRAKVERSGGAPLSPEFAAPPSASPGEPTSRLPGRGLSLVFWLLAAWGAGTLALLARLTYGALAVRRIARGATVLSDSSWTTPLYEAADRLELTDAPRLLSSEDVQLPFTAGLLRPTIVLPGSAGEWSEERRRAVLAHELAHIRRRDLLSHMIGRVACALYWFHPLVWVAARRARAEGERACDDVVLATGARASAYADHLLQIVCAAARTSAPAVAIPMAQRKEFEGRMLAILEPGSRTTGPGRRQAAALVAGLAGIVLLVSAAAPAAPAAQASPGAPTASDGAEVDLDTGAAPALAGDMSYRFEQKTRLSTQTTTSFFQDTGKAKQKRKADGDWLGGVVADALGGIDIGRITSRAMQGALAGSGSWGGMPMPTPTPTPTPTPMVFGGHRDYRPHFAKVHRSGKHAQADPKTVAALIEALRDESAAVRARAAYSLGELGDPKAIAPIASLLTSDKDPEVRHTAAWSLGELDDAQGAAALGAAVRGDASAEVRNTAAWALGELECSGQVEALGTALRRDADAEVRANAAWALGECEDEAAVPALSDALKDGNADVRQNAAWALGEIAPEKAPAALLSALRDATADVRETAAWALGEIGDPAATPALVTTMKDAVADVRQTALWAVAQTGGPGARDAMLEALKSTDPEIRRYAAQALAEIR